MNKLTPKNLLMRKISLFLLVLTFFSCTKDQQFKVTVNINPTQGGSVAPPSGDYDDGDTVNFIATANSGYEFLNWSGDLSGSNNPAAIKVDADKSITAIFDALNKTAPKNAIMCVDVGNNAYSFGRYFEPSNQTFLMSGYLGSIGFAFPAAIGAWAAVGHTRPIIAVAGDGGFCQYLADFTTAVKYSMPIKVIVINNNELGKILEKIFKG